MLLFSVHRKVARAAITNNFYTYLGTGLWSDTHTIQLYHLFPDRVFLR